MSAAPISQPVTFGRRPAPTRAPLDIAQEVDARIAAYEPVRFPSFVAAESMEKESSNSLQQNSTTQRVSKVKTSHVLIFMCLHIGNDPPDCPRIEPCAKLECWTDPVVAQARCLSRGSDGIADTLEQNLRLIQKDAMYKKATEVTIDDAKQQLQSMRRKARDGRVLFYYNGHGMPKATPLGELWFFDKDRSHYVPFNVNELATLVDSPAIYVFDCNSAGSLLKHWQPRGDPATNNRIKDFMICACSEGEFLPMNPHLPADVLTSCLTTPVRMVLEWYIHYSYRKTLLPNVTEEMLRHIPGDLSDRKTPLGELNWIFMAVTDTIAWCTTPEQQFHQVFRQDVVVKSLFRNFLLADKLLREVGCTPVTYPALSDSTYSHYMWDTWEVAMESVVCQLPNLLNSDMTPNTMYTYKQTSFFSDQLTAFEVWVEEGDPLELPEQLPCVVLALTQISHRVRALTLLSKYLATGPTAVHYTIRCGALIYVSKLLVYTQEVFLLITLVWAQLVAVDPAAACAELLKNQAEKHFIRLLQLESEKLVFLKESELHSGAATPTTEEAPTFYDVEGVELTQCKAAACFILCKLLDHGGEKMYVSAWNFMVVKAAFPLLSHSAPSLRSWGCLLLAKMFSGLRAAKEFACKEYTSRINLFTNLLRDKSPSVRSSCVTLLATLLGTRVDLMDEAQQLRRIESDKNIVVKLREALFDHSSSVREELAFSSAQIFYHYGCLSEFDMSSDVILSVSPDTDWKLKESGVNVKSTLSSSRPTDNLMFDDSIQFNTTFLAKDDPLPPTQWSKERITPRVLEIIQGLLHDASVILVTLYRNSDQRLVGQVVESIASNVRVASFRLLAETSKISLGGIVANIQPGITGTASVLSEEDRAKRSRNRDLMRRLLLDIQGKKFEPTSVAGTALAAGTNTGAAINSTASSGSISSPLTSSSSKDGLPSGDVTVCPAYHQFHALPVAHDAFTAGQFRLLEPQVIVAERNNRISIVDYEVNGDFIPTVLLQLAHPGPSIHDLLIVNDLAVDPGLLVLNRMGGFTLYHGIHDPQHVQPHEVCSFSSCSSTSGSLDLKMGYRSDGHLIYAGPINIDAESSAQRNELAVVNLAEEQVVQRISVVGDATITCLSAHPTSRCIFLGLSDGIVKYYDDRTKQGQVSAISNFQKKGGLPAVSDSIVGLSVVDDATSGATTNIFACTMNSIRIFDLRQPTQPLKIVDIVTSTSAAFAAPPTSTGGLAQKAGQTLAPPFGGSAVSRSVSAFNGGHYTGLCCAMMSDGVCDIFNGRGQGLLPRPIKVKEAGPPGATFMHALRPMAFLNGEIVSLT